MEPIVYVAPEDPDSFLIHWLLVEKEAPVRIQYIPRQGIQHAVPPYYIDNDVLIHEHYTLVQFLQERYPGEQLMPHDPVTRAQMRQACHDIREEESILSQIEVVLLTGTSYLAGREFSIVDIYAGARIKFQDRKKYPEVQNYHERLTDRWVRHERNISQRDLV
jgi:glutathione S-transferase